MSEKILVAINCCVYNHELYLRDCLQGFVMQKTDFPFVAIVHDDASTDNSAAIIREYAEKYPNIIKPIYETENQFSKADGSLGRVINRAIEATGAKYIAMCEGDDYWIDPLKLQKQVDFMEANNNYSICFHKAKTLIHSTGELKEEFIVKDMPYTSSIVDLAEGNYIHMPTVLYRKYPDVDDKFQRCLPCLPSDYALWMLLAEKGLIYKINESMAVYRCGSGMWSDNWSYRKMLAVLKTITKLSCVVDTLEAKAILNTEVQKHTEDIINCIANTEKQYNQIRSSRAYRLGKLLLKPFKLFKK